MTKLSAWLWNTKINSIPHWEVSETNYLSVVRQLERERETSLDGQCWNKGQVFQKQVTITHWKVVFKKSE